uniref:NADH-ubiquinone oxidoreductase chain 6 n=1 Tax=Mylabris aulica TaxID=1914941 RepID=A0A343A7H3_9CUCU|nr:NADH dehydrogenase subunit 6 [Mylabris aulica]APB02827.1 NADH dehydrogenase subunit 6 [Mylabris aulica]
MTFITLATMFSIMFVFLKHPLSLGLVLLAQTSLVSLISGRLCPNFWFSYILFLIMIGGMLILFIYMTSIASNEKFSMNMNSLPMPILLISLSLILSFSSSFLIDCFVSNDLTNMGNPILSFSMVKFTLYPMSTLLMFLIMYLFTALIAIVKIIGNNSGPLRPKH